MTKEPNKGIIGYSEEMFEILEKRNKLRPIKKTVSKEQWENKVIDWTDFYRKNWEIYATEELGIPLFTFQQVILHEIGVNEVYFLMCSRGLTKSFLGALAGVVQAMLYPYSEIVLTSTTIKTATKMVKEKIEKELFTKFSPKLRHLFDKGLITIKYNQEEVRVDFLFNKSWIKILPEADSSLGERSNCLLFEEVRLMKQYSVDSIFMPMSRPRQAFYLSLTEFQIPDGNKSPLPDLVEPCRKIYMTSTKYKYMWFFNRWKQTVAGALNKNLVNYGFMCGDIFTALEHGIKTEQDLSEYRDTMSEFELRMEIYNEPIGEAEGSFYTLEEFKRNCVITNVFIPPNYEDFVFKYQKGEVPYFREKKKEEKRAIYVDFAFADTTNKDQANDNTVIGCMSGFLNENKTKILRNQEYMETFSGGKKDESIQRIRELFYFYQADYILLDLRNGGEDRFIDLTKSFYHEEIGMNMNGFGITNENDVLDMFCSSSKYQNLRERTVDRNAIPVVIPVVGTDERNNNFHIEMKNALSTDIIRFPIDETQLKTDLAEDLEFITLESDELMQRMLPHIQCSFLIDEAIKLEKTIKNGFIKLATTGRNDKDRIVATEYANYLFYLLELKTIKKKQDGNFNANKWKNVII